MAKFIDFIQKLFTPAETTGAVINRKLGDDLANIPALNQKIELMSAQSEVLIYYPKTYADVLPMADRLKLGGEIKISLDNISKEEAKRLVDFISGIVYVLDGSIEQLSATLLVVNSQRK